MSMSRNNETPSGISPGDIYFVVFRHKWKIIILTLVGLAAATAYYFTRQPLYQSVSKIFIRYVTDNRGLNSSEKNAQVTSLIGLENVMNSEMEILTSYDLAAKVATNFGPEKILAKLGGGSNPTAAASVIKGNLKVEAMRDSSVLYITFRHPDPDLVQPVLAEIISDYLDKHLQVHSAIGISEDVLQEKTTQWRLEIAQTEDELRMAKTNAGIISIAETEKSYSDELSSIRRELRQAKASLFEHQTSMRELASAGTNGGVTNLIATVPLASLARYKFVCAQLASLERHQNDYVQQGFTEQSKRVQETRDQLVAAAKVKVELEAQFPALMEMDTSGSVPSPTGATESVQAAALPRQIKALEAQLAEIQG